MATPTVSVLINCLNGERFLKEAIDSVYAQSFRDWEIVLWDNASTDGSAAIAKRYDDRLRYFRGPRTVVLGEARRLGAAQARGDFIAILDADDIWLPNRLAKQMALAERDPTLALVFSDAWIVREGIAPPTRSFQRCTPRRGKNLFLPLLTERNFVPASTILLRRHAVEDVGGFDPVLSYTETLDLLLRVTERYAADFVDEPLAQYRVHAANLMAFGTSRTTREVLWVIRRAAKGRDLSPLERLRLGRRYVELRGKAAVRLLVEKSLQAMGKAS